MSEPLRRMAVIGGVMALIALLQFAWLAPAGPAPFSTALLLLGVFACATYGGLWPGLAATAIAVAVAATVARSASPPGDVTLHLALLGAVGVVTSLMAQAVRALRVRADMDRAALRRQMQERAAAEMRLASTEQRFRKVVDALPEVVFTASVQGRVRLLNRHWLDAPASGDDAEPQDLFALVHPDDLPCVRAAWDSAIATGGPLDLRCRLRARDARHRWAIARAQVSPVPGAVDEHEHWFGVILDIDKALAAEQALRDRDERLRLALEANELGMWDYDFASDTVLCSERVYTIFGLEPRPLDRAVWLALVVPEDVPALVEHVRAALAAPRSESKGATAQRHGTLDIEYRMRRASDDAVRWVALTGRVTFDAAEPARPVRAIGTLRDVTRHREAVEQLRQSEERLALAQQAGHIGMFDWDVVSNRLTCSATEEALLGFRPGGFPGTYAALDALIHPADRVAVETAMRRSVDRAEPYAGEFRIVRPDGAIRWISARAMVARAQNGAAVRVVGVHRDVTEDKLAAQRLEASEERFRLAAEALDGLIYDHDPIDDTVERSRGMYELTGFHADEVPATGQWWRSRIHPEDLERTDAAFDNAVLTSAVRLDREYRVRHRSGHWVHVNDHALLVWRKAVVGRIVGVVVDVSERRRIERVLHDADRRKDEFLAVLAHELRNPLAPIRNAMQVIVRAPGAEAVRGAAAILERQVSQMVRLIDDLLDVSRIARGKLKLQRRPTQLLSVIQTAVETVEPLLQAKRHVFERTLPDAGVVIDADGLRLSQVVANLLHNAAKYTPPGGHISLVVEPATDDRVIEIRVSDTGVGISSDALESIFTMFSQLPQREESGMGGARHEGLGIGLALARAVVDMHGGSIQARSEGVGRGSEFVLRLPRSEGTRTAAAAPGFDRAAPRRRILVVDDNRDSAESLAAVLRLDGHEVLVAHGGREAVQVAERELPALVLLDIGMPDMDGFEVARTLRASEATAQTCIVALSGYGQAGDRERSLAAGCDGHLVKPVAASDLATWLERAKSAHNMAREPRAI